MAVVLLTATGPLARLPLPVLAVVVFGIGVQLIDVAGLRRTARLRRVELAVAALTAVAVVGLGVEQGIVVTVAASMADHLRRSHDPTTVVLVRRDDGHWHSEPATPNARTSGGLLVYRFLGSIYFAKPTGWPRT